MISDDDLMAGRAHFMDDRQLEKDYLQTMLLYEICSVFSSDLVFKGGTALKRFYGLDRFSEDLDFTYMGEGSRDGIGKLEKAFTSFGRAYEIADKKRRGTATSLDYELKIRGPLFGRRKIAQAIEINLSFREKVLLKPDVRYIGAAYPDIGTFFVYVMRIEEMLAEKARAILTRRSVKARDIYDMYYIKVRQNVGLDRELIRKKLAPYGKDLDKRELSDAISGVGEMEWKSKLSNVMERVPDYAKVRSFLLKSVREEL